MEFFYVVKATQKSGKPDAAVWFTAKTEARANLQLDVELEDAQIETGRGKDYQKPIRTDFPVFNDLPEESTVDYTWCERYELADDQRTWRLKSGAAPQDAFHQEDAAESDLTPALLAEENGDAKVEYSDDENAEFQLVTMPFRIQLLAQLCAEAGHVCPAQICWHPGLFPHSYFCAYSRCRRECASLPGQPANVYQREFNGS